MVIMTREAGRPRDDVSAIIEVYLDIFNDLFSAFMQRGLEHATERTNPYLDHVFKLFPKVFSGFRLEFRELNHYLLLENSKKVDKEELFLGLQMLIRIMYDECKELVKDVGAFVTEKTRASVMRNYGTLKNHGLLESIPSEFIGFEQGSKEVLLPYGRGYATISVPRDAEVLILKKHKALKNFASRLQEGLANPIGCERLEDMVEPGEKVAVIIDDHTRKTPTGKILPIILEKIEKRTKSITIVVATGLHRTLTKEEIKDKVGKTKHPVVVHDANSSDLVTIGKMFTGTELKINRAVAEADFVLSLGSIEPHPYAGFSGGAKCILPGVAGRDAIVSSHLLNVYPDCAVKKLKDNPMRQEIENAGRLANLRFIVNTIPGSLGEVLDLVCGDPKKAFDHGATLCEKLYSIEYSEKADIVVATPGGHPKDSTLYLALRGLRTAELMLKEKGTIILVAKCEERKEGGAKGKDFRELMKGDPRDLISYSLLQKYNLVLISEDEGGRLEGVEVYRDPNTALRRIISRIGLDAKIIVVPNIYMIPKMRISEKVQLESIMKAMEEGVSIVDEDMKIGYMNRHLLKTFGATEIGRPCYKVFAGRTKPCVGCSLGKKTSLHKTETLEISNNGKTYLATHSSMKTPDDRVMVLEILTDITERKKLEEKIKETRDYLTSLVSGTGDAIITVDLEGKVTSWNKAAEDIYGWREDKVLGEKLPIIPPDLEEDFSAIWGKIKKGETISSLETVRMRRDGSLVDVSTTISPVRNAEGAVIGMSGIQRDITERKELERQLKEYSQQLERKVEERTRELKKANELKDLFTDIMRHDLLNPLGVIKGVSQFMGKTEEFKGRKEIEVIGRNAEKIEGLIESSSKFSRISDLQKLDFQELDLDEILSDVIKNMQPLAKEKGMRIKYKGSKGSAAMVNSIIEDVFANLLSNAIKYSPPKTQVSVALKDLRDKWQVTVKDEGEGIPDEHKRTIFERFIRADKRGVKGTGLGLAIVKRTMDLHKGNVWVEDNPRGGSIFYVTLPKQKGR